MKRFPIKMTASACILAVACASLPALADSGKEQTSDLWSKASLTTTYTLNRYLNPFKIDTEVHDGVATLRGSVDSKTERDLAEELALGVDGIKDVKNELEIDPEASSKRAHADNSGKAGRSFMRKFEDANLTAKVKSQLLWNSSTDGLDIDVDTRNGIVNLSGEVDSEAAAELAEQIARNTSEVLDVKNQLKVSSGAAVSIDERVARKSRQAGEQFSDGWITTKVKSALLYNRHVDGSDINVETRNGVVSLGGHVDSDFERDQAISIARGVKGVKNVKPSFEPK